MRNRGAQGAAAIFNTESRIAYWVGPPFGGGQWHAECRGDAKALNAALADFARLDVKSKQVVVRSGYGVYYNGTVYGQLASRLVGQPPFATTSV